MAILKCMCTHEAQDQMHGKGMRVHNRCNSSGKGEQNAWRCTVCGDKKMPSAKKAQDKVDDAKDKKGKKGGKSKRDKD